MFKILLHCIQIFSLQVNYGSVYNLSKKHVQLAVTRELSQDIVFVPTENNIAMFDIFSGKKLGYLTGHYGNVNCCLYENCFQVKFLTATFSEFVKTEFPKPGPRFIANFSYSVFPLKNAATFITKSKFGMRRSKEGGVYQRAAFNTK